MNNLSANVTGEALHGHPVSPGRFFAAESLLRNTDPRNLVAPLREARAAMAHAPASPEKTARELQNAVGLQEKWEAWLLEREVFRNDIQRGRECLQEIRTELVSLRAQLADWPACERICGHNPLSELLQSIVTKERIEEFLPIWLENREQQLAALKLKMEACAQQNGLEHLL